MVQFPQIFQQFPIWSQKNTSISQEKLKNSINNPRKIICFHRTHHLKNFPSLLFLISKNFHLKKIATSLFNKFNYILFSSIFNREILYKFSL